MEEKRLYKLLSEQYGIEKPAIRPGPRQFVAETFIVRVKNEDKFFLKVVPKTDFPRKIVKSLPTLKYLVESGLKNISNPVFTVANKLLVEDEKYIYVLFVFIEGKQTFNYDNRLLAEFLAELHHIKVKAQIPIETESFSSYVDELFPKTYNTLLTYKGDNAIIKELQEVLEPYKQELQTDWTTFQGIANECKQNSRDEFVITHGDAPGNIILNKTGEIYIIDWDDIMIAPPERDIWFLKDKKDFVEDYLRNNPNFKWNYIFYSYYVYWRMFDDLFGWIGEIMAKNLQAHKVKNLNDLKKDYFNWLRPLVRNL